LAINVLKVLEQEGHLSFNENIFIPSQICFTIPKTLLHDFEQSHPNLEPVMKCLLRTYEGIYDNRVSINENFIAKLTRLPVEKIRDDLRQLNALNVIEYLPQKETPQIHFLLNRAPAEFLYIDNRAYQQRKKLFEERTAAMLGYIQPDVGCRSKYIANYFGDAAAKNCGICDACLSKKDKGVSRDEFNEIERRVLSAINGKEITIKALMLHLHDISKEKSWKVLEHLQSEKRIVIDAMGRVSKK
jgi:ATP-dependent DNA helicase RecQ